MPRKKPEYTQKSPFPKISVSDKTYMRLKEAACESGQSIAAVANQAIEYAMQHLRFVDEE